MKASGVACLEETVAFCSKALAKLRKATRSFVMFVCPSVLPPAWNNSACTGRIFKKFWYFSILRNFVEKIQVLLKSDRDNGYLNED
jgi:hypothetical protein